jgi:long-chain fatty acid transport protein
MRACNQTARALARRLSRAAGIAAMLGAGHASAGGFLTEEHDARSTGRGGAVIADPDNASAVYFNPGGLAQLNGVQLKFGAALVAPTASFTGVDGAEVGAKEQMFVLPNLYLSGRLSKAVALGLGVTSPFGLALDWPATSPGRSQVRQAQLRTVFVTPAMALDLSHWVPGLGVGAGLDLVPASVRLTRDVQFGSDVGSAALSGTAFGFGARAGVVYRPQSLPQLAFGLSYRSPIHLEFEGEGDFDAPPAYRASLPRDGNGGTEITLPQAIGFGVSYELLPAWEVEVDGNWRAWSSYDKLEIQLPNGEVTTSNRAWRDTFTVRIGTEYTLAERWALRAGFIWDPTPIPATTLDFQLPDANRVDVTLGFGAKITENITVDAGALWVLPQKRSTSNADPLEPPVKGSYEIEAWVFGLSMGVAFDAGTPGSPEESYPLPPIEPTYSFPPAPGTFVPPRSDTPHGDTPRNAPAPCTRRPRVRAMPNAPRCSD